MSTGYFATITPLGRAAIRVALASDPTWKVSEVGGWLDGTASCFILPQDRQWLREADVVFDGPLGPMYHGRVRHYDPSSQTLSCVGWHMDAMATEPTQGSFCVTDLGAWSESARKAACRDITMQVQGIDGGVNVALSATWEPVTKYPANSYQRWRFDLGESQQRYLSLTWARASTDQHIKVYPLVDGNFDSGELPLGSLAWEDPASGASGNTGVIDLGVCRGYFISLKKDGSLADTNGTTYQTLLYNIRAYGPVAPRYDASDGLTALRAADVVAHLVSTVEAGYIGGADISEDLTVVEPFDAAGSAADQMAALLQIADGAFWWEQRGPGPPWAVYRQRTELATIQLPAEDGVTVSFDAAPADTSGMFSAAKFFYTDHHGVVRSRTYYDTDPTHYLVKIGRYNGGPYGPKWAPDIDIGAGTAAIADKAAATFFAYIGPDSWTGTMELVGAAPYPAYFRPGTLIRCQTLEWGSITARVRDSDHTGLTRARIGLDNTPNAGDIMARAVEGLNRARAFTKARAIKVKIGPNRAIKKQMKANAKAAKARKK